MDTVSIWACIHFCTMFPKYGRIKQSFAFPINHHSILWWYCSLINQFHNETLILCNDVAMNYPKQALVQRVTIPDQLAYDRNACFGQRLCVLLISMNTENLYKHFIEVSLSQIIFNVFSWVIFKFCFNLIAINLQMNKYNDISPCSFWSVFLVKIP